MSTHHRLQVAASKGQQVAVLLDTKGPEIRTAMLKDHKPLELATGQIVNIVAVGEAYETFEGYHDPETGEASTDSCACLNAC